MLSLFIFKHFNLRKTILIEPDEENLDSLYKNIRMNNLNNKKYKIYKNAIYKNNSILLFDNALDYHARRISNRGKKKVKGITIKNIFEDDKLNHVDIFKIDIEGAEWTLLQQSNRKYFNKCKLIILEYHLSKKFSNVFIITSYFKKWHICIKAKDGKMGLLYMINPKIKL